MSKWDQPYRVFETSMYPAKWKVGRFEDDDNATYNYFIDKSAAETEAVRRCELQKEEKIDRCIEKIKWLSSATKHEIQGSSVLLFRDEVQIGGFSLRNLYAAIGLGKDAVDSFVNDFITHLGPH